MQKVRFLRSAHFALRFFTALSLPAWPASFEEVPGLDFDQPVYLSQEPGTQQALWILEKSGQVKRVDLNGTRPSSRSILDISSVPGFSDSGEQGLLGMALDPNFSLNGYVYFYQSHEIPTATDTSISEEEIESLIVRYQWQARLGELSSDSRKVLFRIPQAPYSNHKAGMIAFGPDNHLYIATGDGGSGGDPHNYAQNPGSLLGKILRLQVINGEASVPADNPFVTRPNYRPEIWALGLRNPWRFSFDRVTGDLWAGDVGQNSQEEIDIIVRGGNYGWKLFEGNRNYDNPDNRTPENYKSPVWTYGRSDGYSVVGGYVYRGPGLPDLQGSYIFGDYGSGQIWTLRLEEGSIPVRRNIDSVAGLVSFAENLAGDLYAVSIYGKIYILK